MICANRFLSSPRLRAQTIRRTGRRLLVCTITSRLLATGYYPRCPARRPRLTLVHRRRCHRWARRHHVWVICYRVWDIHDTVSSLTNQDTSCITQMGELSCAGGRVRGTLMSMCMEQMVLPICHRKGWISLWQQKWAGGAGEHHGPPSVDTCAATKSSTLGKSQLPEQLCPGSRQYFPKQPKPLKISWRIRMWKSWIGHPKVRM